LKIQRFRFNSDPNDHNNPTPLKPAAVTALTAKEQHLIFIKVAFSTFWFKFGAIIRRQAERRGKRHPT